VPKLRVFTPYFPYPPAEGASHVIHGQALTFAEAGWDVEMVFWKTPPEEARRRVELAPGSPYRLGGGAPAGDGRGVIRMLPADTEIAPEAPIDRASRVAASLLSPLASPEILHYPPRLAPAIERLPPADLSVFHYSFSYAWLKRPRASRRGRTVVHLHNLESELFRARTRETRLHWFNYVKLRRHEAALATLADELWFLSPMDAALFRRRTTQGKIRLVPPTADGEPFEARRARFALRGGPPGPVRAGFVGNLHFLPNRLAVEWILKEVAPRLAKGGFRGELAIAGRDDHEDAAPLRARAAGFPFVRWQGFQRDLEPFWDGLSYLLACDIGGSGVKIKLIEALASGVPVLCNTRAQRQLDGGLQNCPLVTADDDPENWSARLLAEAPFETRSRTAATTPLEALSGRHVYGFALDGPEASV